jgi:hypothetical protein
MFIFKFNYYMHLWIHMQLLYELCMMVIGKYFSLTIFFYIDIIVYSFVSHL